MALPKKLKNFDCFQDGVSWLGQVDSVSLPKLTRKMEDYRAGGMAGPVKLDFGQEALELGINANGLIRDGLRAYAATTVGAVQLRFAGAFQREDTGLYDAVEVMVRGRYSEIDMGDAKAGEQTAHKFTMPCAYYRLTINGVDVIEIDMLANRLVVDGVDVLAAERAAMGHW